MLKNGLQKSTFASCYLVSEVMMDGYIVLGITWRHF